MDRSCGIRRLSLYWPRPCASAVPPAVPSSPAGTLPNVWSAEQLRLIEWLAAQCSQIFEVTRRQKALADRAREVEAANSAKDNFIAMLSHELRTPLTPVMASVSALERDERLPADVKADIHMILRNVAIQSRLIDDLLDLTRISRGRLELVEQKVLDLSMALRDAAVVVASDLGAKRQTLALRLAGLEGCLVKGDSAAPPAGFLEPAQERHQVQPGGGGDRE